MGLFASVFFPLLPRFIPFLGAIDSPFPQYTHVLYPRIDPERECRQSQPTPPPFCMFLFRGLPSPVSAPSHAFFLSFEPSNSLLPRLDEPRKLGLAPKRSPRLSISVFFLSLAKTRKDPPRLFFFSPPSVHVSPMLGDRPVENRLMEVILRRSSSPFFLMPVFFFFLILDI